MSFTFKHTDVNFCVISIKTGISKCEMNIKYRGVARVNQRFEMESSLVKNEYNLTSLLVISTSLQISD